MGCGSLFFVFQGVKLWLILRCTKGICLITTQQMRLPVLHLAARLSSQGTLIEQAIGGGGVRVPYEGGGQGLPRTGQPAQHKEAGGREVQYAVPAGMNS